MDDGQNEENSFLSSILKCFTDGCVTKMDEPHGTFTLHDTKTDTETETDSDTDQLTQNPMGFASLCSMGTST